MAKAAPKLRKTLSQANLVRLGAERLAGILMDAAAADPTLKRSLRLEIAAELGAEDLAGALGKRMDELASSKARISWRKRPELLRELSRLRVLIVDRLAEANKTLAFASLVAWVDLQDPLQDRTKDPRGELPALFAEGAGDVARLAGVLGSEAAVPVLLDAVTTRASVWAGVIGVAAVDLDLEIARGLLAGLTRQGVPTSGRLAPVIRRLADRTGAVDPWLASFDDRMRRDPAILVEAATRLAKAGRAGEARGALEAALERARRKGMGWRAPEPPPQRDEAWHSAEIAVLDAEGLDDEAMLSRWARFERLLTAEALRDILDRLDNFDDVEATDRAIAFATQAFDLDSALSFLMAWGALREAAEAISRRRSELEGRADAMPLWASRLSSRYPLAAVLLLRARARALVYLSGSLHSEGVQEALDEAEALAASLPDGLEPHAEFVDALSKTKGQGSRPGRR